MLIDIHIHVGQFNCLYFAPSAIKELMEHLEVGFYAVSSTTQCEENYPKVMSEIHELTKLDGQRVLPTMWITPTSLKGNIAWYLESDIKWRMLKIHPYLNQNEWIYEHGLIEEVIDIARELKLPLLIHTGNENCCQANLFENTIKENKDITFILAHGRPHKDAIQFASKYEKAYVDSAFMPIEDMKAFCDAGLSHKLLWGTDMCIPQYFYPEEDMVTYYKRKLDAFRNVCSEDQYNNVTYLNAKKIFNL